MRISDWSSDGCSSDLAAARRSEPHNASSLTSPTATASSATALKPTSTPGSPSSPTKESASSDGYATTATSVTWPCLVQSQRPGHEPTPTPTNTGPWSDGCSTTDRKSAVKGKRVAVMVYVGSERIHKKKKK